jgi:phenylacetate-coenzyme A ligase PaaK-like adenylate-forming protein
VELTASAQEAQAVARAIQSRLRDAFALRVPISMVEPGTLPRFDMKAKRWIRKSIYR